MTAVATEAGHFHPPAHAAAHDRPAVPLGYASPTSRYRPPPRLSSAGVALAVGLVLLWTAMSALRGLAETVTGPAAQAVRYSSDFQTVFAMMGFFAALCTLAALLFLVIGLKWLRASAHAP